MPKMQAKMAISRTTSRFLKQSATNWSIIESHRALDHYSLAGLQTGLHRSGRTLLVSDVDISALKRPVRDLHEDAGPIIGHQESRGRHHQACNSRRNEGRVRKNVVLHGLVSIEAQHVCERVLRCACGVTQTCWASWPCQDCRMRFGPC